MLNSKGCKRRIPVIAQIFPDEYEALLHSLREHAPHLFKKDMRLIRETFIKYMMSELVAATRCKYSSKDLRTLIEKSCVTPSTWIVLKNADRPNPDHEKVRQHANQRFIDSQLEEKMLQITNGGSQK